MVILVALTFVLSPRYVVTYKPGGETIDQVIARTHAKEVIGGDYYARNEGYHLAFDLVIVKGKLQVAYQRKRAVLVISRSGLMRIEKPYRRRRDDYYALSGSTYPTKPGKRCWRQLIVLIDPHRLRLIKLRGNYCDIQRRVEKIRQAHKRERKRVEYLLMDGGHSVHPYVRMPTHLARLW